MSARRLSLSLVLLLMLTACGQANEVPGALALSAPIAYPNTVPDAEPVPTPDAGPVGCSVDRYVVVLPSGWFERECRQFSSTPLVSGGVDSSEGPEITLSFTSARSYADALVSIETGEQIIRQQSVRIDGLHARQFVLVEDGYDRGERVLVLVDAGDGVFAASTNVEVGRRSPTGLPASDWFADVKVEFAHLLRDVTIHEQADAECPPPIMMPAADTDGAMWTDLDNDGVAELLYRTERLATGERFGLRVVDGCALVPVTDGTGVPVSLEATATETRERSFSCSSVESTEADVFDNLTTTRTLRSLEDGAVLRQEATAWTYDSGVLTAGAKRIISDVTVGENADTRVAQESCIFNESLR